jgi:hypothetical protein
MHHAMSPEFYVVQDRVHGKAQYHAISPELYVVQENGMLSCKAGLYQSDSPH